MTIYIKNMVCNRCILVVQAIFDTLSIPTESIDLGEVTVHNHLAVQELQALDSHLEGLGFARIQSTTSQTIERIKTLIIDKIATLDISEDFVLSEFLRTALHKDYTPISKLFSQNMPITLEQYFILQKIEKVKELLLYNEYSLTEIAGQLGYKSVQHLSSQFKSNIGCTPSAFKKLKQPHRNSLDFL